MRRSPVSLQAARAAKSVAVRRFGEVPEVNGIGVCRRGEDYAVKINLDHRPSVELPDSIDGVEVVIEVVGTIRSRKKS